MKSLASEKNINLLRPVRNQAGFAIVQTLIAASIVLMSALALGTIAHYLLMQSAKSQTQSVAISLQTELLTSIQRSEMYANNQQITVMHDLVTNNQTGDVVGIQYRNEANQVIAVSGYRIGLNFSKAPCDPNNARCPFRIEMNVKCSGNLGCRAAYRINISKDVSVIGTAPLGAGFHSTSIVPILSLEPFV